MKTYVLKETIEFKKRFRKLPIEIKQRLSSRLFRLEREPYAIGKPLNTPWFRELKFSVFRVYYIIDETQNIILLAGISKKHDQSKTIVSLKFVFGPIYHVKEVISAYHIFSRRGVFMASKRETLLATQKKLITQLTQEIIDFGKSRGVL